MPTELPTRANLEHLRKQAKDLLRARKNCEPQAAKRIGEHFPRLAKASPDEILKSNFTLQDALLVVAREYGFDSWAKLKREVEKIALSFEEKAERFVVSVCDQRIGRAKQLLEDTPEIAEASFHTALVLGDANAVENALKKNPSLASQSSGPKKEWYPLHYVAASKFYAESEEYAEGLAKVTQLLLDNGADPNAYWISDPWPDCPIKPLYYATGENNSALIAQKLIKAGAELDDGESVYHAAEHYHIESLEMLRDAGADLGQQPHPIYGNTPLHFILGMRNAIPNSSNTESGARWLLKNGANPNTQMKHDGETALHAAVKAMRKPSVIEILLQSGANPNLTRNDGKTPYDLAIRIGNAATIELLETHGAQQRAISAKEKFIRACMSADRASALALKEAYPNMLAQLDEEERYLLVEAAIENKVETVRLMLDLGFDIAFKGSKEWGTTPLHSAAWYGQTETVLLLLERGAPIDIKANPPEDGPPLGWAIHGSGFCKNPNGDYPTIVEAIIKAGGKPFKSQLEMASDAVAKVLYRYLEPEQL